MLLSSRALQSELTSNFGFVSDPELDKRLDPIRGQTPEEAEDEWAALDEYVVNEKSYVAPYGVETSSQFFSERMDAENCVGPHPVFKNDWLAVLPEVGVKNAAGGRSGALPRSDF